MSQLELAHSLRFADTTENGSASFGDQRHRDY